MRKTKTMNSQSKKIYPGAAPPKQTSQPVQGEYVTLLGEPFYKIQHYDAMEPFFMSIMSSSNHWMFIASTGGLTAGRVSAEQAIFPYYTVDKITENHENTGPKTILLVDRSPQWMLWEPFSDRQRGIYSIERNLYKNVTGTVLVFEEKNLDLGLAYRYAWRTSEKFGLVKTAWLTNTGDAACRVEFVDGLQNILPANISSQTQNIFSPLLDAYKRSEIHAETGLAIYTLSSRLTDLAEPSESLLATTVAQVGLDQPVIFLSSAQLDAFRTGKTVQPEAEVRGQRCAYFAHAGVDLAAKHVLSWHMLADTGLDAAAVVRRLQWLKGDPRELAQQIEQDIAAGQARLWKIVASADGLQASNNAILPAHHFANVMFNVMRGGVFADQYWIQSQEFADFVSARNRPLLEAHSEFFATLPAKTSIADLHARAEASGDLELVRLSYAYLPLTFSRRHGDPSRPWNRFAINIQKPDGSLKLDYEGNWRDIFQNWEALAWSYPEYVESMISTFLNATTADGYNPYRITHHGLDWEVPEPGNPWANIGYWSDHQIIYLQKLMEISARTHPGKLQGFLNRPLFSYANVPYRIKPYADLLKDPYNSIAFDWELERRIEARVAEMGTDGKLVAGPGGQVLRATLAEKLLTLLLAKLVNFVPEGGIWMNTQRPEWNDANNALVGKGLSVVTLCYLRRYIAFCKELFAQGNQGTIGVRAEVQQFYARVREILQQHRSILQGTFNDEQRRTMMDDLGQAGGDFRWNFYESGFSGEEAFLPVDEIASFLDLVQQYVEHTLRANQRSDALYHAYNILHLGPGRASISYLYEMLEGQVAILSSGLLNADESLALLDSLRNSALYQADQHSYILYPDRKLPGFLEKNCLSDAQVAGIQLVRLLVEAKDLTLFTRDGFGHYHFSGPIRNVEDVKKALAALKQQPQYAGFVDAEQEKILVLFEETFHHNEFTGRSGTFFAFEGLGSIYWHMVAKLLLAAQETAQRFKHEQAAGALVERYRDIRKGLGFNKTPAVFGAFPTDPYSHTPKGQGAKQPGMTGLVKEEILTRQAELGITVENGQVVFDPFLLDPRERLVAAQVFTYLDVHGQRQHIELAAGTLACTLCQTPVLLQPGKEPGITVNYTDGLRQKIAGYTLDAASSQHIFDRDGRVRSVFVTYLM
jgi:hypothetical protein